jgi:hypothetical protein
MPSGGLLFFLATHHSFSRLVTRFPVPHAPFQREFLKDVLGDLRILSQF